jgi:hypothetical protein
VSKLVNSTKKSLPSYLPEVDWPVCWSGRKLAHEYFGGDYAGGGERLLKQADGAGDAEDALMAAGRGAVHGEDPSQ